MIIKSITSALIAVCLYCICYQIFIPDLKLGQHQWQNNVIIAQDFIYANSDTITNVLVGSSLSNRLSIKDYYNLSFTGLSLFDGLGILVNTVHRPKKVFIETNYLLRKEDKQFTRQLFSPLLINAKRLVPALREGKQPLGLIIVSLIKFKAKFLSDNKVKYETQKNTLKQNSVLNTLFEKLLANQVKNYSNQPSQTELSSSINELESLVNLLESKKIQVIFYEMPVHPKLLHLPFAVATRDAISAAFPPSKYRFIKLPNSSSYNTTDGVHLNHEEALKYEKYFIEQVKL